MASKNFLLLSLEDSKTKKIANVVSNESCRKILDYLSQREATESELAEKLQIPISTVHYNLQQLMETGLINAEEFHYSEKGKEVLHYKLANKYIIISPKGTYGLKEKLKGILPTALIALGAAGIIQLFSKYFSKGALASGDTFMVAKSAAMEKTADEFVPQALRATAESMPQAAPITAEKVYLMPQNIALWFLIGALFALAVYFVWGWFRNRKDW
ncbi:helix-turn-helix domain-containing protein [Candidatus Woesearchaeota archaeon]|nr:helix-turn-helix domain-containing protein [Candidatus Woesearchaeota archaeon]